MLLGTCAVRGYVGLCRSMIRGVDLSTSKSGPTGTLVHAVRGVSRGQVFCWGTCMVRVGRVCQRYDERPRFVRVEVGGGASPTRVLLGTFMVRGR